MFGAVDEVDVIECIVDGRWDLLHVFSSLPDIPPTEVSFSVFIVIPRIFHPSHGVISLSFSVIFVRILPVNLLNQTSGHVLAMREINLQSYMNINIYVTMINK